MKIELPWILKFLPETFDPMKVGYRKIIIISTSNIFSSLKVVVIQHSEHLSSTDDPYLAFSL